MNTSGKEVVTMHCRHNSLTVSDIQSRDNWSVIVGFPAVSKVNLT